MNPAKLAKGNALAAIAKKAAALSAGAATENKKWGAIISPQVGNWQLPGIRHSFKVREGYETDYDYN